MPRESRRDATSDPRAAEAPIGEFILLGLLPCVVELNKTQVEEDRRIRDAREAGPESGAERRSKT